MEMPTALPSGGLREGAQRTWKASWGEMRKNRGWIPPGLMWPGVEPQGYRGGEARPGVKGKKTIREEAPQGCTPPQGPMDPTNKPQCHGLKYPPALQNSCPPRTSAISSFQKKSGKALKMRCSEQWALNPAIGVFIREEIWTQRGVMWPQAKEHLRPPEAGRGPEGSTGGAIP